MSATPAAPYDVVSCEYSILGEGCLSGLPAVFLCLNQPSAEGPKAPHTAKECADLCLRELARQFRKVGTGPDDLYPAGGAWVVILGTDPASQNLEALVGALQSAGFWVAVEVTGTERGHIGAGFDWVTVRPYIGNGRATTFDEEAISVADEIKAIIGHPADVKRLVEFLHTYHAKEGATVCIQPAGPETRAFCIEEAMAQGWRLSLPTEVAL